MMHPPPGANACGSRQSCMPWSATPTAGRLGLTPSSAASHTSRCRDGIRAGSGEARPTAASCCRGAHGSCGIGSSQAVTAAWPSGGDVSAPTLAAQRRCLVPPSGASSRASAEAQVAAELPESRESSVGAYISVSDGMTSGQRSSASCCLKATQWTFAPHWYVDTAGSRGIGGTAPKGEKGQGERTRHQQLKPQSTTCRILPGLILTFRRFQMP